MKQKLVFLGLFIGLVVSAKVLGLDSYFTLENLQAQKEELQAFVAANYALSVSLFIGIYCLSVAFIIPIATVLTLASGFLFGTIFGTMFAVFGATLGAMASFYFARFIIGDKIQQKYAKELSRFNAELEANGYGYLFALRFLPIFPFFLINLLCGITRIDGKTFFITTLIGIIPGGFVYVYAGSQLSKINALSDIFSKEIFFALALLGALSLVPILYKKIKH